ncbi:MAG TPA: hypothetical protein VGO66_01825 [Solirubrobacterales bacterium]|jgi:hypothetical protein|nr:hypothetical protein [Solirubrobacterales bacterium]
MGERLSAYFPFILAMLLPPVGVLLGVIEMQQDRELGMRIVVVALLAVVVWTLLFVT